MLREVVIITSVSIAILGWLRRSARKSPIRKITPVSTTPTSRFLTREDLQLSEAEALQLRAQTDSFDDIWNDPAMDVYDHLR